MRAHRNNVLFNDGDLHEWLAQRLDRALRDLDALSEAQLLASPLEDLIEHFVSKHELQMVAVDRDAITVPEHGDVAVSRSDYGRDYQTNVHGVNFAVPFTGEP